MRNNYEPNGNIEIDSQNWVNQHWAPQEAVESGSGDDSLLHHLPVTVWNAEIQVQDDVGRVQRDSRKSKIKIILTSFSELTSVINKQAKNWAKRYWETRVTNFQYQ